MITATAIKALQIVSVTVSQFGGKLILIGAAVPHILAVSDRSQLGSRTTRDIDGAVEAKSWEQFQQIRDQLISQGFRQGVAPHNFTFNEIEIDLIPFGSDLIKDDQIIWPETKMVMSTLGLQEAFEYAVIKQLTADFSISAVTIPGLILLKIICYMDRQRARDLQDIIYHFEHYDSEESRDQRFNVIELAIDEVELKYEETGAY